jgi:tetratricopeptide (TPR) repeat protein
MYITPLTRNPAEDCSLPLPAVSGDESASEFHVPGYYSIAGCVRKYGPAAYLRALRKRLEMGLYDRERFCRYAAQAYLWAGMPKRGLALLESFPAARRAAPALFGDLVDEARIAGGGPGGSCTLNMIVKNEETTIAAALDSVDDVVDEIVICDTGSTDRTTDVAQAFGATIVRREWRDDFSAARNAALENSTGSWILWLDADDRLKPQSRRPLADLLKTSPPNGAAFRVVNIQDDMQGAQFMQVRLFPRIAGARFERRVHEQVSSSLTRLGVPCTEHPSIVVFHAGYNDAATNRKKAARNKPLILAEIADNHDSPVLLLSLADCHMILGETKEALAAYERVISHPLAHDRNRDVFVQAHFNVGLLYRALKKYSVAKIWFEKTIQLDATRTEAWYLLGLVAEEEGNEEQAFTYFLSCSRKKPPVRQTATDSDKIRIDSVFRISRYLYNKGMFEQCEGVLVPALDKYPNVVNFHTLLARIFMQKGRIADAARHFMTSLSLAPQNNPDPCLGMAEIYSLLKDKCKAGEFLAMAGETGREYAKKMSVPAQSNRACSLAVA